MDGQEIDCVCGATQKQLKATLGKYRIEPTHARAERCCCCFSLGFAMFVISLIQIVELVTVALTSKVLRENDSRLTPLVIWNGLNCMTMLLLLLLGCCSRSITVRRANFIVYTTSWIVTATLACMWLASAWLTSDYKCTISANNCIVSRPCQFCYILLYCVAQLALAIPLRIWFSNLCYRYW